MAVGVTFSSFRDPAGAVFSVDKRIFRIVSASGFPSFAEFLNSQTGRTLVDAQRLIGTREVSRDDFAHIQSACEHFSRIADPRLVEHERVWFPSYPYEWPNEMLYAAGELTLELAEAALAEGFGLKDASPYNVLFQGPKPVFVDVLSFERRDLHDPIWLPYAQFLRMFVFPLLVSNEFGMSPDQVLLGRTAGLEPEEVYAHSSWWKRLRPPLLTEVSIPTWLNRRAHRNAGKLYNPTRLTDPEKAKFILAAQFRRLQKVLRKASAAKRRASVWSGYMKTLTYSEEEFQSKSDLIHRWLFDLTPSAVLDIGCNTGHFSALAAKTGARVVGIDIDPVVVGQTWLRAREENLNILPLVVNVAHPSPATGWRNAEYPSFLDRAAGSFEMVLMLAVLHHLLVSERVPLVEILNLAAELTDRYVVIEYIAKDDPMFQYIARGREALHADFTQAAFELACQQQFHVIRKQPVKGNLRWLYLLRKRRS